VPKLLSFVPCERVIVSRDDNSLHLVGVMQGFKAQSTQPFPTDEAPAQVPLRWAVLTLWYKTAGDEGSTYEQKIELVSPSGKVLLSQATEFVMTRRSHRNTTNVFGFPIAGIGDHTLRLSLRASSSGESFQRIAEYPLFVSADEGPRSADSVVNADGRTTA